MILNPLATIVASVTNLIKILGPELFNAGTSVIQHDWYSAVELSNSPGKENQRNQEQTHKYKQ